MARYQKGDIVRVLPYDEIASKFVNSDVLPSGCHFVTAMKRYCEKEFSIDYLSENRLVNGGFAGFYRLAGVGGWSFTDEMLEDSTQVCVDVDDAVLELPFEKLMSGV